MVSAIAQKARDLGFIAVGFSRPGRPLYFDFLKSWIAAGKHGDMTWLERHIDLKENPCRLLEGCRTVISLAFPYPSAKPSTPDGYTVSRYARPDKVDYHDRLRQKCRALARLLERTNDGCRNRICVDSAPIMERSFALSAGIGFIGKNNALIIPGQGSYQYLAEILTTAALDFPDAEPMETQCGTCNLCLEACPTGALSSPFDLDARKCLSYLTIEHKGPLSKKSGEKMGRCFFGCDRCQEVCPFNRDRASVDVTLPSAPTLLAMDKEGFKNRFGKTALSRPGLEKVKDNLRALLDSEEATH